MVFFCFFTGVFFRNQVISGFGIFEIIGLDEGSEAFGEYIGFVGYGGFEFEGRVQFSVQLFFSLRFFNFLFYKSNYFKIEVGYLGMRDIRVISQVFRLVKVSRRDEREGDFVVCFVKVMVVMGFFFQGSKNQGVGLMFYLLMNNGLLLGVFLE